MNPQTLESLNIPEDIVQSLIELPPDRREQVFGFVRFLSQQHQIAKEHPFTSPKQRIPDLDRGAVIWISEDFDEPLPDDFWCGENDPLTMTNMINNQPLGAKNIPADMLDTLKEYFGQVYQDRLEKVILFGSRARGDERFDSDLDILVVLKGAFNYSQEIERTGDFLSSLCLENNIVISRAFVDLQTFLSQDSPFLLNVKREGIVL